MRWLAPCMLLLCACSFKPSERLDVLFERSHADLEAGELARAQNESEHGITVAGERRDAIFRWKFIMLRAEILLNKSRAEAVLSQLGESIPQSPEFAPLSARKKMLEGQAQSIVGHTHESDHLLEEARHDAVSAGADDVLVEIDAIQGASLLLRGRHDDAERVLQAGLERARRIHSAYRETALLVNLGMIRLHKNRYDEAAGYFEQASQVSGPRFGVYYSVAQDNLAMCYQQLGEIDRAIRIQL